MATNAVSSSRTTASSSVSSSSSGKGMDKGSSASKATATFSATAPLANSKVDKQLGAVASDLSCSIESEVSGKSISIKDSGSPITLGNNESLTKTNIKTTGKGSDAIHVTGDNVCVTNVNITNMGRYASGGGHTDALQVIPKDQYIGGVQRNLTVKNLNTTGSLEKDSVQGIISTDGCLVNLNADGGNIRAGSPNKLTFNGLASGSLNHFRDQDGNLVQARLQPLRIGGNPGIGNTWILSISPESHECNPSTITGNNYSKDSDKRKELPNPNDTRDVGLCHFELNKFKNDMNTKTVTDMLDDVNIKAGVDNWLEWVKTTKQSELYGRHDEIKQEIERADDSGKLISQLKFRGIIAPVFYQFAARNYGDECSSGNDKK